MPLNDIKIKNAQVKDKQYKLGDEKGLFLLVKPNGSKYWRLKYRFLGKEKNLAIGLYPEISLKDARQKCIEARKQLDTNIDPSQKKKVDKLNLKFIKGFLCNK
jgi:hypothetical protein